MKITQTFKFHFEVEGNRYDFTIDAENVEEAKRILVEHLSTMVGQLTKE